MGFRTSKIAILGSIVKKIKKRPKSYENIFRGLKTRFFVLKNLKMGTSRGGTPPSFTYWGFTYWGGGVSFFNTPALLEHRLVPKGARDQGPLGADRGHEDSILKVSLGFLVCVFARVPCSARPCVLRGRGTRLKGQAKTDTLYTSQTDNPHQGIPSVRLAQQA